ncbi:MAG TPA: hypothetical protein VNX15_00425, partial [Gemmatimonadales bacterium]|nr:hypothetical protein [Gemmatimonadales bacterium]
TITAAGLSDSISALLALSFRVKLTADTGGSVTSDRDSALAGAYLAPGTPMTLVAHPHTGSFFLGWGGDTAAADTTLLITLSRPYRLTAQFSLPLTVTAVLQQAVTGTSTLTPEQLSYLDRIGNKNGFAGDIGDFLAWVRLTHAVPGPAAPAPAPRRMAARGGRP